MAKYHNDNRNATTPTQNAVTSSFANATSTQMEIGAVATTQVCRGRIYELNVGADGAPNSTDCQIDWRVARFTVTGTGVASTPNPVNFADAAARSLSKINDTAQPTITANSQLLFLSLNQRASQRWVASPEGELIWPATAGSGLTVDVLSPTYTGNAGVSVQFEEF
jgi:hypothetical protein